MVDYFSWTDALPTQPGPAERAPDAEAPAAPTDAAIDRDVEPQHQ